MSVKQVQLKRLLICVQAVDAQDPVLSFFINWIEALAGRCASLEVVCLKEGEHTLPENVRVYSLGKGAHTPRYARRVRYAFRFLKLAWRLRDQYDAVLVFQNEEYPLIAGLLWWLLRKPIYLWRNHYKGTWRTAIAVWFCRKVFYTSNFSYTARFKKAGRMPVGVDTALFAHTEVERNEHAILFFARMAPSKNPHVFLDALELLAGWGTGFRAHVVGDPLPRDRAYYDGLRERASRGVLAEHVTFFPGVAHTDAPRVFAAHGISVNLAGSGMYDKTIFEAAAAGCLVLASSKDFAQHADARCVCTGDDVSDIAGKLSTLLALPEDERARVRYELRQLAVENDVETFAQRLVEEIV